MIKIFINSIEKKATQTGVPFWVVVFDGDKKATAWDEGIAAQITLNVNKHIDAEIKDSKGFLNIRKVQQIDGFVQPEPQPQGNIEVNPSLNKPVGIMNAETGQTQPLMSARDTIIVAQVLMKGAIEMSKGHTFANLKDESQYMCECIPELHGVLKVALDKLNE